MRLGRVPLVLFLLFSLSGFVLAAGRYGAANATNQINYTSDYLATANQSAYLIFSPNMTRAYGIFNNASNISSKNPSDPRVAQLLAASRAEADRQVAAVQSHATVSFEALGAVAIVLSLVLVNYMAPAARGRKKRRTS